MILITGGIYQGKHKFAYSLQKKLPQYQINDKLYSLIEEKIQSETHLSDFDNFIENFANENKNNIIISLEIGASLIPMDKHERNLKKAIGRANIILAEKSEEVYRVCCSLGMRLK